MSSFWIVFVVLLVIVVLLDRRYGMLRDVSAVKVNQSYSWSTVQLAWWTVIVLPAFISIFITRGVAPSLNMSTVILLGISSATTVTARAIDFSDQQNPQIKRTQDDVSKNFFLDILSDENGVSMYRFQTIVFNAVFGVWFINAVLNNLHVDCSAYKDMAGSAVLAGCKLNPVDYIMPVISDNNLILLGLSSATYAALKTTENKPKALAKENRFPAEPALVTSGNVG